MTARRGTAPRSHCRFMMRIQERCATVEEAIAMAKRYDWGTVLRWQALVADATGDAVVISAGPDGQLANAFERQPDGSWKAFWDIYNSDLPFADALPVGEEEAALMRMEQEWAVASVKNDWAAFDKMLAAEYASNVDGVITPKKQFLANMKGGAFRVASATAGEMKVLILGETGIVHGVWTERSALNGRDMSGTYRYTDLFAKRDGRWQCVAGHANKVQ